MTKYAAFGTVLKEGQAPIGGEAAKTLTVATASGGVATFTTSTNHGYSVGDYITVQGVTPAGYNGTWIVLTQNGTTGFTANIGTTPGNGSVFGTVLRTDTFATITQVLDISAFNIAQTMLDDTTHDSPGGWEEVVAGIVKSGELSLDIVYDSDDVTHVALRADSIGRLVTRNWKLVAPSLITLQEFRFTGGVAGLETKSPVNGLQTASIKFKVSGPALLGRNALAAGANIPGI
jgi:predicted secreted protein